MKICLAVITLAVLAAGCGSKSSIQDGRHFGFIVRVADHSIAFDEAQFLSGDEAQKAAEADGALAPGEPVSNDYYIRNPDHEAKTLRTASASDLRVTVARCTGLCKEGIPSRLGAIETGKEHPPYWIAVEHGRVTRIDQLYVP